MRVLFTFVLILVASCGPSKRERYVAARNYYDSIEWQYKFKMVHIGDSLRRMDRYYSGKAQLYLDSDHKDRMDLFKLYSDSSMYYSSLSSTFSAFGSPSMKKTLDSMNDVVLNLK